MKATAPRRVFLSSTYADLQEYRSTLMSVLQGFEAIFIGMEHFGAAGNSPLKECLRNLESADLVICLVGTRYGSCPHGNAKCYTQIEIEHALKHKKPVLAYFIDEENQPVLRKYVDDGEQRERLDAFKAFLRTGRTTEEFTTPEDLGFKVARDLSKLGREFADAFKERTYRECAYDALAEWYDLWYGPHWKADEPCNTICTIVRAFRDDHRGHLDGLKILDSACGTGNTLVAFSRIRGVEICGTDGSREMLARAKTNCDTLGLPTDRLIAEPLNWTDMGGYLRHFRESSFDLVVNTANSLCHIPPTKKFLGKALHNFYRLLKPGGLVVVDTKRFIRRDLIGGATSFSELKFDASTKEWVERVEREEEAESDVYGKLKFHSRLVYDLDPSTKPPTQRALIVITIHGERFASRTLVVPYYPLPSATLAEHMKRAGFKTTLYPAKEGLAANWKYDVVVGQKR